MVLLVEVLFLCGQEAATYVYLPGALAGAGPISTGLFMSQSLDNLFELLRKASAPVEIAAVQHAIWEVWLDSGDTTLNKRLEEGMRAMAAEATAPL